MLVEDLFVPHTLYIMAKMVILWRDVYCKIFDDQCHLDQWELGSNSIYHKDYFLFLVLEEADNRKQNMARPF